MYTYRVLEIPEQWLPQASSERYKENQASGNIQTRENLLFHYYLDLSLLYTGFWGANVCYLFNTCIRVKISNAKGSVCMTVFLNFIILTMTLIKYEE